MTSPVKIRQEGQPRSGDQIDRFFMMSLDMLCIAGFDGYFKRLNPAWERTLGFSEEELLSKPYLAFVHPDDRQVTHAEAAKINAGADTIFFENRYLTKDGTYKWLSWKSTPLPDQQLIYAVARDISDQKVVEEENRKLKEELEARVADRTTQLAKANERLQTELSERKRLEQQLLQAQKMEAIGRLAGGVAHDFNNLLTIITGYSELMKERLPAADPLRAHAEEILKAGNRAASLTRQLLAFSRRQVLQPQVLDLNAVVGSMEKMLRRLIGEDIDLVTFQSPNLGRVLADPGQIEQVLMNLAVNARDAMPRGGKLTLETTNVELDEAYSSRHFAVTPGPYVMLAVSDTGIGMDSETQKHLFEPFFTTKEKGKGTGLGLATVYGIVKQSGGNIWVYSEPGRGSAFKVYLPRVREEGEAVESRRPFAVVTQGSETILLVEDEGSVRSLVRGALEANGYTVLEARGGDEALAILERYAGEIQLLLTDVVMPQMSGRELAERIAQVHRETKVLFMSGYTDDAIVHHGVLQPGTLFLEKPFTPEAVLRKVREALGAAPHAGDFGHQGGSPS